MSQEYLNYNLMRGIWPIVFLSGIFLSSCNQSVYVEPKVPEVVSFKQHIIPLLNRNCNSSGCHSGIKPQGNLNLEPAKAYNQLSSKQLIDTLRPKQSAIYAAMTSIDRPMPPSGKLDTFYIQTMLKWIEQGAKEN